MSRTTRKFYVSKISRHVCHCASKGTVWVLPMGDQEGYFICSSPICNALTGDKKVSDERFKRMLAETQLTDLQKEILLLKKRAVDAEELVGDLLIAHADIVMDRDNRLRALEKQFNTKMTTERHQIAETVVKILPLPKPPQAALKIQSVAGKTKRTAFQMPTIDRVARKAEPIPDNFMVGEAYVSGMASTFGESGF
jgi:hypothetical protein